MSTMNVEQKLQRAHVWLLKTPQFALYSGLILMGSRSITEKVPTAGTDGYNTMYNPEFVSGLSEPELRGLVLHETMHKAFKHFYVWGHLRKISAQLLNISMDYVINIIIQDANVPTNELSLPEGGCIDARFRGMSTGEVFKILQKEGGGDGTARGAGSGDGTARGAVSGGGFDIHDWDGADALTNSTDSKAIANEVDAAIRMGVMAEKMRGHMEGVGMRELGELLAPVVRWEDELMEFVNNASSGTDVATWRKPSRKWVYQDVYMPSSISEVVGPLVVAIDTSGSISGEEINRFLSELVYVCTMCSPERVDLIYWGSSVVGHEVYGANGINDYPSLVGNTKPMDGGGTEVSCVSEFLREKLIKPQAIIILTDGCLGGDWGVWDAPTLWGITTKGVVSPVGKSIHIGG